MTSIINEMNKLPLTEKLLLMKKTLDAINKEKQQLTANAADTLYNDYKHDKELTIFTQIDTDSFYETR